MDTTEKILLTGLHQFREGLDALSTHNELYDLTQKELTDRGLVDERIYENSYAAGEITYQTEENGAILVLGDGVPVGYVKKSSCERVARLLEENAILSSSLELHGGPYKIILTEADDSFSLERETAGLFGCLNLTVRENAAKEEADSGSSYIDTSYALEEREDNQAGRGFAPLLIAGILTAFYLVFSCLYWYQIKRNGYAPDPRLGEMLPEKLLLVHLGLVAAGFFFHFISLFSGKSRFPFLAALFYAASIVPAQNYAMYLTVQIVFCLAAGLRKRSGNGFLKALFFLLSLAVPALALLNYFQVFPFDFLQTLKIEVPEDDESQYGGEDENGSVFEDWEDFDEEGSVFEDWEDFDEEGSVFEEWEDFDEEGSVYEDWEDWDEEGSVFEDWEDWDEEGSVYLDDEDWEDWDEEGSVYIDGEEWGNTKMQS